MATLAPLLREARIVCDLDWLDIAAATGVHPEALAHGLQDDNFCPDDERALRAWLQEVS